jgi:hypothetical protein
MCVWAWAATSLGAIVFLHLVFGIVAVVIFAAGVAFGIAFTIATYFHLTGD